MDDTPQHDSGYEPHLSTHSSDFLTFTNEGVNMAMKLDALTGLVTTLIQQTSIPSSKSVTSSDENGTVASPFGNDATDRRHPPEAGQTRCIYVSSLSTKDDGHRVYDKQLACFFCPKLLKNKMKRHLMTVHQLEPEVATILALSSKSEQNVEISRLTNRGNFNHNARVLEAGAGMIIVARRSLTRCNVEDYLPCVHCLKMFVSGELGRHSEGCKFSKRANANSDVTQDVARKRILGLSRMLLAGASHQADSTIRKKFREEVLDSMRPDQFGRASRADPVILRYGETLHRRLGRERLHDISQRMRQLGRLVIEVRKKHPDETISLDMCLSGTKFEAVVKATERLCELSDNEFGRPVFRIPSLGLKLGHSLVKCAELKRGAAYRTDDFQMLHDADAFIALHKAEWTSRIASASLATLKCRRYNNPELLPLTSDLLKLKNYQEQSIAKLTSALSLNAYYKTWRSLAEIVFSRVVIFNKRRSGETAKLLLSSFIHRPNWEMTANEQLVKSLCPVEQQLLHR